ncbi:MAG: peptidoglycan binding protein CsiV [Gammaproteobacteria bacterium]|nr:peptidoglycan binding protein CsiV [Gammaproteobacteria bacterium]
MLTQLVRCLSLFVCLTLLGTSTAVAKDYLVEVVLFEHVTNENSSSVRQLYFPKLPSAIGLNSDAARDAGIQKIESDFTLTDSAEKITQSGRYRLLRHFAWRQPGLDSRSSQSIRINVGTVSTVYIPEDVKGFGEFIPASANPEPGRTRELRTTTVNGRIKVHLGRFLHMKVQLVYTDETAGRSYRLSQSRKMRSRELHYIDNQKFGILTRILPIDEDT